MSDRRSAHTKSLLLATGLALLGAGCATPIEIPGNAGLPDAGRSAGDSALPQDRPDGAAELQDSGGPPPPPPGDDAAISFADAWAVADGGVGPTDGSLSDGNAGDVAAGDATVDDAIAGDGSQADAADDGALGDAIIDDATAGDATALP